MVLEQFIYFATAPFLLHMDQNFKQNLNLEQKLNISQQLRHAIELLKFNELELVDELTRLTEENVFLDLTVKDNFQKSIACSVDLNAMIENRQSSYDFREEILEEFMTEVDNSNLVKLGKYIIYSVDDYGYLKEDIDSIARHTGYEERMVADTIKLIKSLSVPGFASSGPREYLLDQIADQRLSKLVDEYFDQLVNDDFKSIALKTGLAIAQIEQIKIYLQRLMPYPLYGMDSMAIDKYVIPDIIIDYDGDEFKARINTLYDLKISDQYIDILKGTTDPSTYKYLNSSYKKAIFLINAIEERRRNSVAVAQVVFNYQKDYILDKGSLKVLRLRDVAAETSLSISTISRITNNKIAQYAPKYILLRDLFEGGVADEDNEYSKSYILSLIKKLIENEDRARPLSDSQVCKILEQMGIPIKRRTISKYRNELGIPSSRDRSN